MVCILCDSKTKITNSRNNAQLGQTWRRHTCTRCYTVFTTREAVDMSLSYRVEYSDGSLEPFSRDKLLVSINVVLGHRTDSTESVSILTNTIIGKLAKKKRLILPVQMIYEITEQTLRHFSRPVALIYSATNGYIARS